MGRGQVSWGDIVGEDVFDGGAEEAGKFEGERQGGIKLARLDGVDGLPRDLKLLSEVGLGPVAFGAKDAEAVIQRYLPRTRGLAMPAKNQKTQKLR